MFSLEFDKPVFNDVEGKVKRTQQAESWSTLARRLDIEKEVESER